MKQKLKRGTQPRDKSRHRGKAEEKKPDTPYRCGKCKLLEDPAESEVWQSALQATPSGKDSDRWFECPKGGPDRGLFFDPSRTRFRRRVSFVTNIGRVRVCSPCWLSEETREGTTVEKCMSLHSTKSLIDEWHIAHALKKRGTTSTFDLNNIPEVLRTFGECGWFGRDKSGTWLMWQKAETKIGTYHRRVKDWCREKGVDVHQYDDLVYTMTPSYAGSEKFGHDMKKATLYVPFDLRFPVEQVYRSMEAEIVRIQNLMLRVSGRERAFRMQEDNYDLAWRDLYCYLRAEFDERSGPEIAAEVIGDRDQSGTIRSALSRIRSRLRQLQKRS